MLQRLADFLGMVNIKQDTWQKLQKTFDDICLDSDGQTAKAAILAKKHNGNQGAISPASLKSQLGTSLLAPASATLSRGQNSTISFDSEELPRRDTSSRANTPNSANPISPTAGTNTSGGSASVVVSLGRNYGRSTNHTFFFESTFGEKLFCEYCFLKADTEKGSDDPKSAYRCETCGYVCHRSCRNHVTVSCVKPSNASDYQMGSDISSNKLQLVSEKLAALEKQIDIELKIKDGLEKMNKAKQASKMTSKKSKHVDETDLNNQSERVDKKINTLKHELQKRRQQYQELQKQIPSSIGTTTSFAILPTDANNV